MHRASWRTLLGVLITGAIGWGLSAPAGAAGANGNEFGGMTAGKGREETFGYCSACHSIRLVVQQRLTREAWDEVFNWMVAEQDMPPPDPELRKLMLDYLARHYGRHVPR